MNILAQAVALVATIITMSFSNPNYDTYTNVYVVCQNYGDYIVVADINGNIWEYSPTDKDYIVDLCKKDIVTISSHNNGTYDTIVDDEFLDNSLTCQGYKWVEFHDAYISYWLGYEADKGTIDPYDEEDVIFVNYVYWSYER